MTEKEKMLSGLPYDASDAELEEERTRIRELVYDYNLTRVIRKIKTENETGEEECFIPSGAKD